jgi:hypothetical protein
LFCPSDINGCRHHKGGSPSLAEDEEPERTRSEARGRRRVGKGALANERGSSSGHNRIYGPKPDGTYVIEFKMADGEALAISVPASEVRVLKYFQERMPYGLFVPDVS